MKKLLTILLCLVAASAWAATKANPMTTNSASAYAVTGTAPVWNGSAWVFVGTNAFGGGGGTTNLTPWPSDINGAGHSLTNAGTVEGTNFVGNGSGLTNIPGSALQSPLNVSSMNVGTLTATNTYLTNGYYFHTNSTTGQWGSWDTNGIHFESNFLTGVWWWRGPTNSMSGVGATTTNFQTDATTGNQTNSGTIKAAAFIGNGAGLTGLPASGASRHILYGVQSAMAVNGGTTRYIGFAGSWTADSASSWAAFSDVIPACTLSNLHFSLNTGAASAGTNITVTLYTNAPGASPVATALTLTVNGVAVTANSGTLAAVIRDNDTIAHFEAVSNLGAGTNYTHAATWYFEQIGF